MLSHFQSWNSVRFLPSFALIFLASQLAATHSQAVLEVVSLAQALARSEKAIDVEKARSIYRQSQAASTRAYDPFMPVISFRASRALNNTDSAKYLNADLNIYDQGRTLAELKITRSEERASALDVRDEAQKIQIAVIEAYSSAVLQAEQRVQLESQYSVMKKIRTRVKAIIARNGASRRMGRRLDQELLSLDQDLKTQRLAENDAIRLLKDLLSMKAADEITLEGLPEVKFDPMWLEHQEVLERQSVRHSYALQTLDERQSQIDSKRWSAYSEWLPKVYGNAQFGYITLGQTPPPSYSISLNLEIPLPLIGLPLMLGPTNRFFAESEKQFELDKARLRQRIGVDVENRLKRLKIAIEQLSAAQAIHKAIDKDREEEERDFLLGAVESSNYIFIFQQLRKLEFGMNQYKKLRDTETLAIKVLLGEPLGLAPALRSTP